MKIPQPSPALTPDLVLYGYTIGVFPMADSENGAIRWYFPLKRAIIPLENYRASRSLRQVIKKSIFEIRVNTNFEAVMRACASERGDGYGTWISEEMIEVYAELHRAGYAHSIEAYFDGELAGGLYGISIGAAFFGESMFFRAPNASKVAFDFLISRLKERQYELLDSQYINDNVKRFGAVEITKEEYTDKLKFALRRQLYFDKTPDNPVFTDSDWDCEEKEAIIVPNTRIILNNDWEEED